MTDERDHTDNGQHTLDSWTRAGRSLEGGKGNARFISGRSNIGLDRRSGALDSSTAEYLLSRELQ